MRGRVTNYELQNYNRPIDSFAQRDSVDLILDPRYQRGSVWTQEQRENLILSMIQGIPIGALYLNERKVGVYAVVDGKQRIETIQMWHEGELFVPAEWFTEEQVMDPGAERVNRPLLSIPTIRGLDFFAVATYETRFRGTPEEIEAQETELFNRLNFGGTPHAVPEAQASYKGVTAKVSVRDDEMAEGRLRVSLSVDPPESLPGGLDPLELYSVTVRA